LSLLIITVPCIELFLGLEYAAQQKQELADLIVKRKHEQMAAQEPSVSTEVSVRVLEVKTDNYCVFLNLTNYYSYH